MQLMDEMFEEITDEKDLTEKQTKDSLENLNVDKKDSPENSDCPPVRA